MSIVVVSNLWIQRCINKSIVIKCTCLRDSLVLFTYLLQDIADLACQSVAMEQVVLF